MGTYCTSLSTKNLYITYGTYSTIPCTYTAFGYFNSYTFYFSDNLDTCFHNLSMVSYLILIIFLKLWIVFGIDLTLILFFKSLTSCLLFYEIGWLFYKRRACINLIGSWSGHRGRIQWFYRQTDAFNETGEICFGESDLNVCISYFTSCNRRDVTASGCVPQPKGSSYTTDTKFYHDKNRERLKLTRTRTQR